MDHFNAKDGRLFAEDVEVQALAAQYGTPLFVYSRATLERHYKAYANSMPQRELLVCYAVKANSNLAVLNVLARLGAGFDIVSGGELERALRAGAVANKIVFSGVGKTRDELIRALEVGIGCFNVESEHELNLLGDIAESLGKIAPISIRVNPNVDPKTHPYISTGLKQNKFGISMEHAPRLYRQAQAHPHLAPKGIDCHIGSQLVDDEPMLDALDILIEQIDQLAAEGITLEHLDLGGGLGVPYIDETPPSPAEYMAKINQRLGDRTISLILEPGRSIAANAGILVTQLLALKDGEDRKFAIVDAAMNDLLRPALYDAEQQIIAVVETSDEDYIADVVGPICETGDFLGKGRKLNSKPGDLLVVRSSGAYGFTMSSNYNSRPRAAEVMVDGEDSYVVRQRETFDDLVRGESLLP